MKKDRSHDRAPGQTAISFSCSGKMKKDLVKLADGDNRNLSNYLQTVLARHIKKELGRPGE
tara:strand:- start:50 stop:232 length:183 start_codon:yes stop_codon:yes gene_type:complete